MTPSATKLGRQWVAGFSAQDQDAAALLIDSLEIHDHAEVLSSITAQIEAVAGADPEAAPMVLIPIRSMKSLPMLDETETEHIAYKTFDPGASFPPLPGSEAEIGVLSKALIEANPGIYLSPTTGIEELRTLKVRTICLITDYCGSGIQATRFTRAFKSNSTIASWMSYRVIQLRIVAYAASLEASDKLKSERGVEFETHLFAKSAKSAHWSKEQRERIAKLCYDYGYEDDPSGALGYGDSFGLHLTNRHVPNNLPQILIGEGGPHPGLFPGRQMPADFFSELPSYRPAPSLERMLRNLGADDLAAQLEGGTRPVKGLRALAALYLLEYGMSEDQVWVMLGLDPAGIERLRGTLLALDCITFENRLTKRGKAELRRARYEGAPKSRYTQDPRPPVSYVPTQLR